MPKVLDLNVAMRQIGQAGKKLPEAAAPVGKHFRAKSAGRYGRRHVPGVMNKTEQEYAVVLEQQLAAGEIVYWRFESITFKIADGARFTPDFMVFKADGSLEFVDCKGGGPVNEASIVRAKCAATVFYMFKFVVEQKQSKKNGGGWNRTEF